MSLGVSDFIHSGEFYDLINNFSFDQNFYKKWCDNQLSKSNNAKVLEVCCGTGRITIPLFKSGIN